MNLSDLNILLATIGSIGGALIMVLGLINNQIKNNINMIHRELDLRLNNINTMLESYKSIIDNELFHIKNDIRDIKNQLDNVWDEFFEQTFSERPKKK